MWRESFLHTSCSPQSIFFLFGNTSLSESLLSPWGNDYRGRLEADNDIRWMCRRSIPQRITVVGYGDLFLTESDFTISWESFKLHGGRHGDMVMVASVHKGLGVQTCPASGGVWSLCVEFARSCGLFWVLRLPPSVQGSYPCSKRGDYLYIFAFKTQI